jgi:hypothetical protein
MMTPLTTCNKEEQHAVIGFLLVEGVRGVVVRCRVSTQYGDSILQRQSTSEWSGIYTKQVPILENNQGTCPHQQLKGMLYKSTH